MRHNTAADSANYWVGVYASWNNPVFLCDINGDGSVTPLDVIRLINYINKNGIGPVSVPPAEPELPPPFVDVNDDGLATP